MAEETKKRRRGRPRRGEEIQEPRPGLRKLASEDDLQLMYNAIRSMSHCLRRIVTDDRMARCVDWDSINEMVTDTNRLAERFNGHAAQESR